MRATQFSGRNIEVKPFAPALGAEIRGIDLADGVDVETYKEIRNALLEFQVLFFSDFLQHFHVDILNIAN